MKRNAIHSNDQRLYASIYENGSSTPAGSSPNAGMEEPYGYFSTSDSAVDSDEEHEEQSLNDDGDRHITQAHAPDSSSPSSSSSAPCSVARGTDIKIGMNSKNVPLTAEEVGR